MKKLVLSGCICVLFVCMYAGKGNHLSAMNSSSAINISTRDTIPDSTMNGRTDTSMTMNRSDSSRYSNRSDTGMYNNRNYRSDKKKKGRYDSSSFKNRPDTIRRMTSSTDSLNR